MESAFEFIVKWCCIIMENSVKQMGNWYHKLIYIIDQNEQIQSIVHKFGICKKININKLLSEKLLEIPKQKYPMFVYDILLEALQDKDDLYILQHIDILFDPQLKINPTQLFEELSKSYKLIVEWPGRYDDGRLYYAEYGHPEYFMSNHFEGKVVVEQ